MDKAKTLEMFINAATLKDVGYVGGDNKAILVPYHREQTIIYLRPGGEDVLRKLAQEDRLVGATLSGCGPLYQRFVQGGTLLDIIHIANEKWATSLDDIV